MRTLGVGTYARVILARHHKDHTYYAIKVLKKSKVNRSLYSQICINILQMPYLLFTSYHIIAMNKPPPPKMATSSGLFLATIYNQSQLAERKHVACYWLMNTAVTAVLLSVHLSVSHYNKISGGHIGSGLFGGGVLPAKYCPCGYIHVGLYTGLFKTGSIPQGQYWIEYLSTTNNSNYQYGCC